MKVEVQGMGEALSKFRALIVGMDRDTLERAAVEGLTPVLDDARGRVPVGATGRLRSSLKIQTWEAEDKRVDLEVISDPDIANYGTYVEYGTEKMTGTPFLRPAFDSNKAEAQARVSNVLGQKIGQVVGTG